MEAKTELELMVIGSYLMWVLGTKCGSFARTANASNQSFPLSPFPGSHCSSYVDQSNIELAGILLIWRCFKMNVFTLNLGKVFLFCFICFPCPTVRGISVCV